MDRISQSVSDIKEHVQDKFECTNCCTLLCWAIVWVAIYVLITFAMIILVTCQLLLDSELYELFPRKSVVPYYMITMIFLQICAIVIYGVAISKKSEKIMLVGMIFLLVLSVIFIVLAVLTQIKSLMEEEQDLSDEKLLDTMKHHFDSLQYMSFWVKFQENYECCGVIDYNDWIKQTQTMRISGGCCRAYDTKTTIVMASCQRYGMKYGVVKGCSRKLNESGPHQVTRIELLVIIILLLLYHIPGTFAAFILRKRFYVLYYLDYDDEYDY